MTLLQSTLHIELLSLSHPHSVLSFTLAGSSGTSYDRALCVPQQCSGVFLKLSKQNDNVSTALDPSCWQLSSSSGNQEQHQAKWAWAPTLEPASRSVTLKVDQNLLVKSHIILKIYFQEYWHPHFDFPFIFISIAFAFPVVVPWLGLCCCCVLWCDDEDVQVPMVNVEHFCRF